MKDMVNEKKHVYQQPIFLQVTTSQGSSGHASLRKEPATYKENVTDRLLCIRKHLQKQELSKYKSDVINSSLRHSTNKQYQNFLGKWFHWCLERKINTFNPPEVNVVKFLGQLIKQKCSHSVINSNKANNQLLIPKLLKGYYNMNRPRPK